MHKSWFLYSLSILGMVTRSPAEEFHFDKPGIVLKITAADLRLESPPPFGGTPHWTPSAGDLRELEERLPGWMLGYSNESKAIHAKLHTYERQYLGFEDKGCRKIWINAFCDRWEKSDEELAAGPLIVDDGGDCYFTIVYDPANKTFSRLSINGEA